MADRYPGRIEIGGIMPAEVVDEFIDLIVETGGSLNDFGLPEATKESVHEALQKDETLILCHDRAPWGEFEALETFLTRHGISFDRHSDAYAGLDGEMVSGRGHTTIWFYAAQNGSLLLDQKQIMEILRHDSSDQERVAAIRKLAQPPEWTPLPPLHVQEKHHE